MRWWPNLCVWEQCSMAVNVTKITNLKIKDWFSQLCAVFGQKWLNSKKTSHQNLFARVWRLDSPIKSVKSIWDVCEVVKNTSPPKEESFSSEFFDTYSMNFSDMFSDDFMEQAEDIGDELLASPGYHCFKDLVCGNVDKESVEGGWTPCGFLVNGLSISLLVICTIFKL